jgi:hypothetical protein
MALDARLSLRRRGAATGGIQEWLVVKASGKPNGAAYHRRL